TGTAQLNFFQSVWDKFTTSAGEARTSNITAVKNGYLQVNQIRHIVEQGLKNKWSNRADLLEELFRLYMRVGLQEDTEYTGRRVNSSSAEWGVVAQNAPLGVATGSSGGIFNADSHTLPVITHIYSGGIPWPSVEDLQEDKLG
ncbi:unnamed protein product, partial [Amoebophrya sp. A25]